MRVRLAMTLVAFTAVAIACSSGEQKSPYFDGGSPVLLLDTSPADGASGVALDAAVEAEFGGAVSTAGVGTFFHLFAGSTAGTPVTAQFAFAANDRIVRLQPQSALAPDTTYVAKIDDGFPDAKGRPIPAQRWTFHTATPPPPQLSELVPKPGRTAVPVNFVLRASFNVPLDPASVGSITAFVQDSAAGLSFQQVTIAWDAEARSLLFTPVGDAVANAAITVAVSASNLRDAFGRAIPPGTFAGWTFSTGPTGDYAKPVLGAGLTVAEAPVGSGAATVTLPTITDGSWNVSEMRWEATFTHAPLPVAGCPDAPDPQLTRVAEIGSSGVIDVDGLSNGVWNLALTAEDGAGRRADPQTASFTVAGGSVTFDASVRQILDRRCAFDGCHAGASPPGYMDLAGSRDAIAGYHPVDPAKPIAVQPYCLSRSYLWWKLVPGFDIDGGLMPPDYVDTPALSRKETETLRQWILQGAN